MTSFVLKIKPNFIALINCAGLLAWQLIPGGKKEWRWCHLLHWQWMMFSAWQVALAWLLAPDTFSDGKNPCAMGWRRKSALVFCYVIMVRQAYCWGDNESHCADRWLFVFEILFFIKILPLEVINHLSRANNYMSWKLKKNKLSAWTIRVYSRHCCLIVWPVQFTPDSWADSYRL